MSLIKTLRDKPSLGVMILGLIALTVSLETVRANPVFGRPKLVLTNQVNGLESTPEFSCSETIHGYLTLPTKAVGSHTIEGIWRMPNGATKEHSKNNIEFSAPGRQTAYVWFSFEESSGGLLGGVRSTAGSAPGANEPYNGQWHVHVLWDGQPLIESTFNVKC